MQAAQVPLLVRKLRSHVQSGQKVKESENVRVNLLSYEMPREQGEYCFRGACEGVCKDCEIHPPKVGGHWEVNWWDVQPGRPPLLAFQVSLGLTPAIPLVLGPSGLGWKYRVSIPRPPTYKAGPGTSWPPQMHEPNPPSQSL